MLHRILECPKCVTNSTAFQKIAEPIVSFWYFIKFSTYVETQQSILTCLLTPWSRVLLEKLTGFAANKKFPAFYGTRKFVTVLTSARHLFLS